MGIILGITVQSVWQKVTAKVEFLNRLVRRIIDGSTAGTGPPLLK